MSMRILKQGGEFCVHMQDGSFMEDFPTIEDAIENVVAYWHEVEIGQAYTIRHDNVTEATICPVGSDSLIVVRNNGDTMRWDKIHYVKVDGRIEYTFAINNGVEYKFKV